MNSIETEAVSPIRFVVQLPPWFNRKLKLWAKVKGQPRATLAANILQARVEANWPEVDKELDAIAEEMGIDRKQLESEWLNGEDEKD